ncbi:hexokinase-2, chloroplastic-like [Papaver somniferum]|uniref:hexokinase-2, chloroplastic-like n=1 Tax=Papaver somniferum TaxID=3469 RepID=UPI000E7039C5|nr:hexokinase-2, chloroplastic-like [Papaver somniferum]
MGDRSILQKLQTDCATPLSVLLRVAYSMIDEMRCGLSVAGGGDLKMLLSYVNSFPTGPKRGLFYALDIGGTNFRVLRILLDGEGNLDRDGTEMKSWEIHEDQKTGTKEGLFGFIASALRELVDREFEIYKIQRETERKIGFTFSFPVNQTAINEGTLIEWTKGFDVSDTVGENVVACLEEALVRLNLNMFSVTALVNDAVGTLAGAIYTDSDVKVAVILGTGTNACYIERMDAIPNIVEEDGHTIINTEWGAFSQGVLPLTEFDQHLGDNDEGRQIFEKMISGKYLGAIMSRILLEMARSENLFGEDYTGTVVLRQILFLNPLHM